VLADPAGPGLARTRRLTVAPARDERARAKSRIRLRGRENEQ
jgi:hypothetical protein